jgi:hypothetical protein
MDEKQQRDITLLVGGLAAEIKSFKENWLEQDRRAADSRKYVYDEVKVIGREVQSLTHQVTTAVKDIAEMKPAVTDWVNSKNQAMGAKTAASILGKGVYLLAGGAVALAGWALSHFSTLIH